MDHAQGRIQDFQGGGHYVGADARARHEREAGSPSSYGRGPGLA